MAGKGKSSWKLWAVMALIYSVGFLVLVQEGWLVNALARERSLTAEALGPALASETEARGRGWFTTAFVDSGVVANSFRIFVPSDEEKKLDPKPQVSSPLWEFVDQRLRVLWTLLYQALQRLSLATTWLPIALVLLVPFVLDGLVSRKIKQTNFDYTSPARHRYSIVAMDVVFALFILGLFAPLTLSPVMIPAFFVVLALAARTLFANTQKKI